MNTTAAMTMAVALLTPALASAGGPFDGTWKTRVDSIKASGKPDSFELIQGMYHCGSCVPDVKVKADGSDQSVSGHDYFDSVAVRIVTPTAIEITYKGGGKTVAIASYSVSDGGAQLNARYIDYTAAQPASATFTEKRVGPAPAGAHAISGSWQTDKVSEMADVARTVSYVMTADALKMEYNGQNYDAKFDGKEYPINGDPGRTVVTVKRIGADTIEEIDKRGGKVTDIFRSTVSGDGKTMHVVDNDPVHETRLSYTMDKQP